MLPAMEAPRGTAPREGELYKKIQIAGKTFPLYYGYYEEFEREHHEPMPIYPDFIQNPEYTDEGLPIVTAMQDACPRHQGPAWSDSCHHCIHFRPQEELFGLCACLQNRQYTDLTTKRNPQGG